MHHIKITLLSPNTKGLQNLEKWWKNELFKDGYTSDKFNTDLIFDDATEFLSRIPDYPEDEEDTISLTENVKAEILNALKREYNKDNSPRNGSSIAFVLETESKKVLFMGDALSETIEQSLKNIYDNGIIYFDAIKVSHHGSCRNNSPKLWSMIDAPIYLISTNGEGAAKHPSLTTLAHIITRPTKYKRTLVCNYKTITSEKLNNEAIQQEYTFTISYDTTINI